LVGVPYAVLNLAIGNPVTSFGAGFWAAYSRTLGGSFIVGLLSLILQATIIHAAASDLNGRPVSLVDSLRVGLYAFLPLLAIGILMGIAICVGIVLLIVPGVMLALAWCVAVPVYVVEKPNLMDVFGRSAALTRGNRWRILGLFVLFIVAVLVVEIVFGIVGGVTNIIAMGGFPFVTRLIVLPLMQAASAMIGATGGAVLYMELRRTREGVGPEGLAALFD
ncbi:MAG: glycerophosphoryl diester phosphodiesterase membrane domain-containing protein, partial [Proteobacteria bacterium]|nr:glycerophosphoryl diester phosphodiesterase membrane domain-containing protein [Pseudomonadota bacterium]